MNNHLKHLQPVANVKVIFAVVLTLLSIYLFFEGTLFGIVLLGAALKLSLREGVELKLDSKEYRKIYSVLDINLGVWKQLPAIEYLSVFKTIKNSRARVIAAEANLGFQVYKLNLFYKNNKHIEVYVAEDFDEAFKVAKQIALALEIDILDATEAEKKWL